MNPGKALSRFGSGFPFEGGKGLRDKGTQIPKKGSKGLIQVTIKLFPVGCKPFSGIMGLQIFEKRKGLWKKTLKPLNRKRLHNFIYFKGKGDVKMKVSRPGAARVNSGEE
jgi:hypothetical protein